MGSMLKEEKYERLQIARAGAPHEESLPRAALVNAIPIAAGAYVARRARRHRNRTFTDGPFTESKELIGGYSPPTATRR